MAALKLINRSACVRHEFVFGWLDKLKSLALAVMAALLLLMRFKNDRLQAKVIKREIDDFKIEANAMQVIIDDKEAEEGIRNAKANRHNDLHHFE